MFCRFLEVYLDSAFHAGCAIGIIATEIRGRIEPESGGPGYAYGDVRHPFPGAQRPTSLERPTQASAKATESPVRLGRAGITDAVSHDPGGCAHDGCAQQPFIVDG
jgi:hypothetical protein